MTRRFEQKTKINVLHRQVRQATPDEGETMGLDSLCSLKNVGVLYLCLFKPLDYFLSGEKLAVQFNPEFRGTDSHK